jgi:hypothetical protein
MNKQQMQDREQFRRYAEAALASIRLTARLSFTDCASQAFLQASAMMRDEQRFFEAYQLEALSAIGDDERIKHEGK